MSMTAEEIVAQLRPLGSDTYKKVLRNHGIKEPVFGVKIEELKKFQRRVKKDYQLALDLYDTGIYDARYLAGLVADESKMTKRDFRRWLKGANCGALREHTVAGVAAESRYGHELALEWIESEDEGAATTGWATLCGLVATKDDADLDHQKLEELLHRVERTIHQQPNDVRYVMNGFVIAVGCYVQSLTDLALDVADRVGPVMVEMGKTACRVPGARESIQKVQRRGTIGKKRKTARC